MRNCAPLVPAFTRMIDCFACRPTRIVIGVNDSTDATERLLRDWNHSALDLLTFSPRAPEYARDAPLELAAGAAHRAARSAHLAAVRNVVIEKALTFTDWDVALMQDAAKVTSPDLPGLLMEDGGDIVAPLSWYSQMPACFYDTWCYVDSNGANFGQWLPREIFQYQRIAVTAVGGVYTVKRPVFESGCRLAGTDGRHCDSVPLCQQALAKGFSVFVRTDLGVTAYKYPEQIPQLAL